MICPECGAEVSELAQCPECGAVLLPAGEPANRIGARDDDAFTPGDADGYWQMSFEAKPVQAPEQVGESHPDSYDPELDELIFGKQGTGAFPPLEVAQGEADGESDEPAVSGIAFALALVGVAVGALLIASVLGIALSVSGVVALASVVPTLGILIAMAIPGLLCCAAGLVLNAKNNKTGLANPRGAMVNMLGAIGLIVGVFALVLVILLNITASQAVDAANENGWDINEVQVVQGSDGTIVVRERSEASSDVGSPSSSPSTSSSSSPSLSSSGLSSASSASGSSAPSGAVYYDEMGNPTLYSLIELSGSDVQALLKANGFGWYDEITAWLKNNGAVFQVVNRNGNVARGDIDKLGIGASGAPVAYVLSVEGYASPQQALTTLANGVVVDARHESNGASFAVIHGTSGEKYLVLVTGTGDNEQTVLVYGEAAIKDGLFRDTIGIDVGSSVTDAWGIVAG